MGCGVLIPRGLADQKDTDGGQYGFMVKDGDEATDALRHSAVLTTAAVDNCRQYHSSEGFPEGSGPVPVMLTSSPEKLPTITLLFSFTGRRR